MLGISVVVAMSQEEPDYESLPSRVGQSTEEDRNGALHGDPHPFWSERLQDEFRLQQRRPRELDMVTLEENVGEVLLGADASPPLEPPYYATSGNQHQPQREELVREAVEDILAENESLRRRVSEMEIFSSVMSSSSRGRRAASSAGQSADTRAVEPDYSRMFEAQNATMFSPLGEVRSHQGTDQAELARPSGTMRSIMQRTGSLERWQALRSFLGFPTANEPGHGKDQAEGGSTIPGNRNVGSVLSFDRTSRELFAAPPQQSQGESLIRSDRPGRVSWIRGECANPGQAPRPDPIVCAQPVVGRSGRSQDRTESDVGHCTSTNQEELRRPRSVDPVFEWFSTVTAPVPTPLSMAGFANTRDRQMVPGPFTGSGHSSQCQAPLPTEHVLSSRLRGGGRHNDEREAGLSALEPRRYNGEVSSGMRLSNTSIHPPSFNSMGSTGQGFPDNRVEGVAPCGSVPLSVAPCLLDASPPQWGGATICSAMQGNPEIQAPSARPFHTLSSPAEALRDLNVGDIGLRGVRLASQGRDLDVVPVVHMPQREPGNSGDVGPPPSLDLLGLDPVPPVSSGGRAQVIEESAWKHNPLMPGAMTPFSRVGELQLPRDEMPPPPPVTCESPRESSPASYPVYTPGGTRVPDGPPPTTPGRAVTFSPSVQYNTWGASSTGVGTVNPPVPPIAAPPQPVTGSAGIGTSRMEEPSKLVHSLPQLAAEPGTQDASVAAGDWIARIRPVLTTLSPSAGQWWQETHQTAFSFYQRWLVGEPSERLAVRSEVEAYRVQWAHLTLINERGAVLILGALTAELQTECVTTRMLTAVGLLFTILVRYQPGGPAEKAAVLSFLSNPANPANMGEAQASLRRWLRLYNRTAELHLHYPDPSLLMKGLDRLSHLVAKSGHTSFRLSSYRHAQRLDYEPTQKSVLAYAQVLLGEVEQQLLGQDQVQADKRARLAKAQVTEEGSVEPNAKALSLEPKGSTVGPKAKPKAKPRAEAGTEAEVPQACRFFESQNGCRYGRACKQFHPEVRRGAGRCYECGATTHIRPACPRRDGPEEPPSRRNLKSRRQQHSDPPNVEDPSQRSLETRPSDASSSLGSNEATPAPRSKAAPPGLGSGPKLSRLSLGQPLGLLDGGATHALRPVKDQWEFDRSKPLKVGLASGETDTLRMNPSGTLVTLNQDTQPILPLGVAIRVLGMSVLWRENRCDVVHPVRGRIRVTLEKGCPEVPRALCLALIDELERASQRPHDPLAEVQSLEGPVCVSIIQSCCIRP